jgi:hypothetical protein
MTVRNSELNRQMEAFRSELNVLVYNYVQAQVGEP